MAMKRKGLFIGYFSLCESILKVVLSSIVLVLLAQHFEANDFLKAENGEVVIFLVS